MSTLYGVLGVEHFISSVLRRLYKHAIQLEPNFPDAYNNLGNAYREVCCAKEIVCY